jgi:hypothetical protein
MYDPRIGRWWSKDIIKQPSLTPYNTFANCPILFLDPDGKTQIIATDGTVLYDDHYKNANGSKRNTTLDTDGDVFVYTGTTH